MDQITAEKRTDRRLDPSRLAERKRRRRRQRQRRRIGMIVLTAALCMIAFFAGRCSAPGTAEGHGEAQTAAAERTENQFAIVRETAEIRETAVVNETEALSDDEKRSYVEAHPELYPEHLVEFMYSSPESVDFIYSYPEYKNKKQVIDLTEEYVRGEIPLLIQWDKRWGYEPYGDDILALSGCGPTCLSMVYTGLTGDLSMHPSAMGAFSEACGYYLEDVGTSWELMGEGTRMLGLESDTIPVDRDCFYEELDAGHPLICSMSPGDFTDSGHFIVICGRKGNRLTIHDPNSPERSSRAWSYDEIEDQIKNAWAYHYDDRS